MKKYETLSKRVLACLCMFVLIATGLWTGAKQDVKADTGDTVVKEWSLYDKAQTVTDTTWADYSLNVTLPEGHRSAENLALYIKMSNIPTAAANGGEWRIKLGNYGTESQKENAAHFVPKVSTTTYEGVFMFTELTNPEKLNLNNAIKMCRIYHNGKQGITGAIIEELKIIDITPHVEEYAGNGVSIFDQDIEVTSNVYSNLALRVELPSVEEAANLALYIKLEDVPESAANGGEWRIKLGNTANSIASEAYFAPVVTAGTYEGVFYFNTLKDSAKFSINKTLATFRLYHNGSVSIKGTKITEAKIIDITPHVEEYVGNGVSIFDQDIEVTSSIYSNLALGVTLPSVEEAANLALYIKLEDVPESAKGEWRIKLGNTANSTASEAHFAPVVTAGTYEGVFYVNTLENPTRFSINKTLATFRLYHNGSVSIKGTKITEAKFIKTTNFLSPSMAPAEAELDTSNVPAGYTFEGWYTNETCTTPAEDNAPYLYAKFVNCILAGKTPDEVAMDTSNVPTGYTFAGWYTDEACTTASVVEDQVYGTAYAKFVREGVQDLRAQYALNNDGTVSIRFITTVDSLKYQKVGFDITINGTTLSKESTVVYKYLYAAGSSTGDPITYSPTDIDAASKYFNTYTIGDVPEGGWSTPITVQSYWVTQDGTKVLGDTATFTISEMMN